MRDEDFGRARADAARADGGEELGRLARLLVAREAADGKDARGGGRGGGRGLVEEENGYAADDVRALPDGD